ncbi:CBS domain-containing protein CBSX6 [Linum grandiflorum]
MLLLSWLSSGPLFLCRSDHFLPSFLPHFHRQSNPISLPKISTTTLNPMASVFLYHVVGDLTVGKPELVELCDSETVESAIRAIGDSTECGIPVWKKRSSVIETSDMRQQRFVGILNSLDIVSFLARPDCLADQDMAMSTPVSQVVVHNNSLLKQVDPGTRLIDALEMMKQGVRRLLVPKTKGWKRVSKRFSVYYHGKWLKNATDTPNTSSNNLVFNSSNLPSSSSPASHDKFCCLSREDVIRFLIGCLGALAPIPLSSISSLGAINPNYKLVDSSLQAIEATRKAPDDPSAVAVVEAVSDGHQYKIIGEISASRLWKTDYLGSAWALANLSAGQFVMGVEDSSAGLATNPGSSIRTRKLSSGRSGGFSDLGIGKMYRGRSAPLTCKVKSSLAAVMAQMLSHRVTHVWVTEEDSDDVLVGMVGYADILATMTKEPATVAVPAA